ncbi:MAG: hypothetical protein WCA77_02695 [Thermoplasmata archaeon]
MKQIKRSWPRRGEMLKMAFEPLPDEEFRQLVKSGAAIPGQQGTALFVAKWRDGPGMDAEAFLTALHAQGSSLAVRRYKGDFNIRVLPKSSPANPNTTSTSGKRKASS